MIADSCFLILIALLFQYLKKRDLREDMEHMEELPELTSGLESLYGKVLTERLSYFRKLNHEGRKHFITRLHRFISTRTYEGVDGLIVTDEMKVLVSAPAIQLTFGMDDYLLANIQRINIYPYSFYSKYIRQEVKGLTTNHGVMSVSYHDISEGYQVDDDGYNLGLHEMAHALKLSAQSGYDPDDGFVKGLKVWAEMSEEAIDEHEIVPDQFLRPYAYTNAEEFFAVCVENFFEAPALFQTRMPELYHWLRNMLGQNPLPTGSNYEVKITYSQMQEDEQRYNRLQRVMMHMTGQDRWHWSANIFIGGLFIGGIIMYILILQTALDIRQWFIVGGLATAIMAVLQYDIVVKPGYFTRFQYIGYTILGMFPFSLSLYIVLNFVIPVSFYTEIHPIKSIDNYAGSNLRVVTDDGSWEQYPQMLELDAADLSEYMKNENRKYVKMNIRKGILGHDVLIDNEIISEQEFKEGQKSI